jgi:hypothetical protein
VEIGVVVGAAVGAAVAEGVAAVPQAESKKTKNKKQKPSGVNIFFTTIPRKDTAGQTDTKFHKGK